VRQCRRLLELTGLLLAALLLFRAVGAEPYGVPTGSMAPTLLGNHKAVTCPRCGYPVIVGQQENEKAGSSYYSRAFCPNCDCTDLGCERVPVCRGDQLLVNKYLFDLVRPERWEMAVFRCPIEKGKAYVKRVVALPGETVEIRDGDIYIDQQIARKSLGVFKTLRIPVYDHNFAPPDGWGMRWETDPPSGPARLDGKKLVLNTTGDAAHYDWLVYHHWLIDPQKDVPLTNEYSYNGALGRSPQPVHDFMLECDVEVVSGDGWLALGITDGRDTLVAELPVGSPKTGAQLLDGKTVEEGELRKRFYRCSPEYALQQGKTYQVEYAFVDRRATLAVNGSSPFAPVDRPAVEGRGGVDRPVKLGARGVEVRFKNVRIFRDIHYTDTGHAVGTPVHLGARQYFVLGDNSPNSEDNRIWSDANNNPVPVPEANFLGKPFLVHMPSRIVASPWPGRQTEYQGIDWHRIRWLR
jgi:signal peptidase I